MVVGAGIMGASTAWGLVRRDWDVVVLDSAQLPNPDGSSGGVHRLIRTTYGAERGYAAMVRDAWPAWQLLEAELGRSFSTPTGMLAVDRPGGSGDSYAAESAATLDALGLPCTVLEAEEVQRRWPVLRVADGAVAVHTEQAGFLRAREVVGALVAWLTAHHVDVRPRTPVVGVDLEAGSVALADGERLDGDRVVVAAGPWTPRLLGDRVGPLTPSRQVVVDLEPPPELAAAWASAPGFLVLPAYGIPPRDELPLKVGDHGFTLRGDPDDDRQPTRAEVDAVLHVAGQAVADLHRYRLVGARTCYYTAADGDRFVVTPAGARGWVLAGFSGHGFKFGPLLGLVVAAALDGAADPAAVIRWAAGAAARSPIAVPTARSAREEQLHDHRPEDDDHQRSEGDRGPAAHG